MAPCSPGGLRTSGAYASPPQPEAAGRTRRATTKSDAQVEGPAQIDGDLVREWLILVRRGRRADAHGMPSIDGVGMHGHPHPGSCVSSRLRNSLARPTALRQPRVTTPPGVLLPAIGTPRGDPRVRDQFEAVDVGVNAGGKIPVRHRASEHQRSHGGSPIVAMALYRRQEINPLSRDSFQWVPILGGQPPRPVLPPGRASAYRLKARAAADPCCDRLSPPPPPRSFTGRAGHPALLVLAKNI